MILESLLSLSVTLVRIWTKSWKKLAIMPQNWISQLSGIYPCQIQHVIPLALKSNSPMTILIPQELDEPGYTLNQMVTFFESKGA